MSFSRNCRDVITKVRRRIHDVDSRTFADSEILGRMDDVINEMYSRMRTNGSSFSRDREDIATTSLTTIGTNIAEYALPEHIGNIELVEALNTNNVARPIREVSLEERNIPLGNMGMASLGWIWSRWMNAGSIQILGSLTSYSTIRIWHARPIGPMHYATVASGSTTSIVVGTPTGDFKGRSNIYVGLQIEVTADVTQASNVGAVRRITANTATTLTVDALPAAANSTTVYATVVPVPGEHVEFLTVKIADKLLGDYGATEQRNEPGFQRELGILEANFEEGLRMRSSGEPPRFTSARQRQ